MAEDSFRDELMEAVEQDVVEPYIGVKSLECFSVEQFLHETLDLGMAW
jgi:hypothetical protein